LTLARLGEKERMDDSELFDVFSADNNPEPVQKTIATTAQRDKSTKQKNNDTEKSTRNDTSNGVKQKRSYDELAPENGGNKDTTNGTDSTQIAKKSRKNNDIPIIVDSFETESDQIVPATQGLQGIAVTDHNIIIKKRVHSITNYLTTVSSCSCFPNCRLEIHSIGISSVFRSSCKNVPFRTRSFSENVDCGY
jgi:hypothetical protein